MPIVWPMSSVTRERVKERSEAKLMADYGLSEKSAKVLRVIRWGHGVTNADIVAELGMQSRSVVGVVNGLVKKGLVEKNDEGKLVAVNVEGN